MSGNTDTLGDIATQYRESVPEDLRKPRSLSWYLDAARSDPKIARNAHQRVADMFDHYGTDYDEDAGIVRYHLATEDPLEDG